jgi:outer membrane lipoprotein-sorting protein
VERITAILLLVLIASGCTGSSTTEQTSSEKLEGLMNESERTTYNVKYAVSGPEAPENTNISLQGLENGEKYVFGRGTPGGDVVTTAYVLENNTVTCTDEPSTGGLSCSVGEGRAIQKMLQIEEWNMEDISYTGQQEVAGRMCERFSASVENALSQGITATGIDIVLCLDSEKGFPSSIEITAEGTLFNFTAVEVRNGTDKGLELPQPVGIVPHCTDSHEIDLTPLKQVEEAEISLNGYSKVVELPERFERGVYSIPEQRIDQGMNNITVRSGGETKHRICYRRP